MDFESFGIIAMRNEENALRGTHIKIPANRPKGDAGIFMCVPLSPFLTLSIGSALQGVPWALLRPPLTLRGTPRDPQGVFSSRGINFRLGDILVVKKRTL